MARTAGYTIPTTPRGVQSDNDLHRDSLHDQKFLTAFSAAYNHLLVLILSSVITH